MQVKTRGEEEPTHKHRWIQGRDYSESRCDCGFIRITIHEMERRQEEWDNYYQLVKSTPAYMDFKEMTEAYKARDRKRMKEIDERIMSRNHEATSDWGDSSIEPNDPSQLLEKPHFPEPDTFNRYFIYDGS